MVSVKFGANVSVDMRDYDYNIGDLPSVTSVKVSTSYLRGTFSDGTYVSIDGKGFSYDKKTGLPNGGEVRSITETRHGDALVSITGLHLSVKSVVKVALTNSVKDEIALVKSVLGGADSITGGNYADVLEGYGGNDKISGGGGYDRLYGGSGNDTIFGGAGADKLFGNSGSDTFSYRSLSHSTLATAGQDTIFDFAAGDKIDVHVIDANKNKGGNQDFSFIGKEAFHGKAGELRFEKKASDTYVYADVNGDKVADFAVHLDDAVSLSKGYFVL